MNLPKIVANNPVCIPGFKSRLGDYVDKVFLSPYKKEIEKYLKISHDHFSSIILM
jgi:hypothetical protein